MHPNKAAARTALERAVADGERLVTDAEVLPEILHRHVAIDRRGRARARGALHVAAVRRHGVDDILTFDRGFDAITGIRRHPG